MIKNQKFHPSVTELGNLQTRIITEYTDDSGKVIGNAMGDPYTPADTTKMDGWDQTSIDIVTAITDKTATDALKAEEVTKTGVGLEEIITHDRTLDDLGRISVRRITRIFDEGEEVSKKYHRSWIMPGDDPKDADVMSKAIAEKLHTQEVIAVYESKMTELAAEK